MAHSPVFPPVEKTTIIYPASFLAALASVQINLGLVFFARDLFHATPAVIGWLAGTWTMAYVAGCLFIRPRFDRVPPHRLVTVAQALTALFTGTMQVSPGISWLFALSALAGASLSCYWPPLVGWLSSDIEGELLSRRMGRFNVSWCAGVVLGPVVCGWLSRIDVRMPLYAGSGLFAVTAMLLLVTPRLRSGVRHGPAGTPVDEPGPEIRSTPLRYPAWISLLVYFFGTGVIVTIFPVHGRNDLAMATSTIGTILFIRGLFNAVAFGLLGRHDFWHVRLWPMITAQVVGAGALIGLARIHGTAGMAVMIMIFGLSSGLSYAIALFHGLSGSANRARRMAIHESILAIGSTAGAIIGGIFYERAGMSNVYLLCAGLLVAAIPFMAIGWRPATIAGRR